MSPRLGNKRNKTDHPNTLFAFSIVYLALNLGTAFQLFGLNLSYYATVLFFAVYVWEIRVIRVSSVQDKRIISIFGLWLVYGLAQFVIVRNRPLFWNYYTILLFNALVFVFSIILITNAYEFKFMLRAATVAVWMNIGACLYEYLTGRILIRQSYLLYFRRVVAGFIGNFNDVCTFMYFGIILFLVLMYFERGIFAKVYSVAGILFSLFIIFFNGARGAIYGIVLFAMLFLLFYILDSDYISSSTTKWIIIIAGILSIAFVVIYIQHNGLYSAVSKLDNDGGNDIRSDMSRVELITNCLKETLNSFGFGIGAGQSEIVNRIRVHNFYIEILCEYGIVFGYFAVYLTVILPLRRRREVPRFLNAITQAFAVSFLVANVTSSSINKMRMLWILLALFYIIKCKYSLIFGDRDEEKNHILA